MVAQLFKFTKNHWIVHLKGVNLMMWKLQLKLKKNFDTGQQYHWSTLQKQIKC